MPDSVVIRRAESPAERRTVIEVHHEATASSEPLAYYQAVRFNLRKRRAATWWLLEVDREPAASLVCYALEFAAGGGKRLPGFGIGAVGTRQAFRKRGLASRLCEHAAARSAADGRHIGLLFSAIPPGLYERLGYRAVPASDLGSEDLEALAASGKAAELVAFDPLDALDELAASYERSHTGLHLHRDPAAWERSLGNNASDLFLTAGSPDEQYVRLYKGDENLEIVECAGGDTAAVVRAVAAMALRLGLKRVDTWLELDGDVARHFTDRGRAATLPMVKGHVELTGARFSSADYF